MIPAVLPEVTFRFMFRPEFLRKGAKLMFREGKTKGTGVVRDIEFIDDPAGGPDTAQSELKGAKAIKAEKHSRNRTAAAGTSSG